MPKRKPTPKREPKPTEKKKMKASKSFKRVLKSFEQLELEQKAKGKDDREDKPRFRLDPMINRRVERKMKKGGRVRNTFTQQYD